MSDDTATRTCEGPGCTASLAERTAQARFCSNNCGIKYRNRRAREGRVCERDGCTNTLDNRSLAARSCSRACQVAIIRARNPEKIRAQEQASKRRHAGRVAQGKKAWHEANRERRNARSKANYQANRERAAEWNRTRYAEHGEEIRARVAQYRRENPDKCRAWTAKYRGLRNSNTAEMIDPIAVFERDGWLCGICDGAIDPQLAWPDQMMASLDHVWPLSKGGLHLWSNVQAAHLRCNKSKSASLPESAA